MPIDVTKDSRAKRARLIEVPAEVMDKTREDYCAIAQTLVEARGMIYRVLPLAALGAFALTCRSFKIEAGDHVLGMPAAWLGDRFVDRVLAPAENMEEIKAINEELRAVISIDPVAPRVFGPQRNAQLASGRRYDLGTRMDELEYGRDKHNIRRAFFDVFRHVSTHDIDTKYMGELAWTSKDLFDTPTGTNRVRPPPFDAMPRVQLVRGANPLPIHHWPGIGLVPTRVHFGHTSSTLDFIVPKLYQPLVDGISQISVSYSSSTVGYWRYAIRAEEAVHPRPHDVPSPPQDAPPPPFICINTYFGPDVERAADAPPLTMPTALRALKTVAKAMHLSRQEATHAKQLREWEKKLPALELKAKETSALTPEAMKKLEKKEKKLAWKLKHLARDLDKTSTREVKEFITTRVTAYTTQKEKLKEKKEKKAATVSGKIKKQRETANKAIKRAHFAMDEARDKRDLRRLEKAIMPKTTPEADMERDKQRIKELKDKIELRRKEKELSEAGEL